MTYRVLALRADSGGCAKYRVVDPANAVQAAGYDFDVRIDVDLNVEASKNPVTGHITVHEVLEDIDLLIMQRPLDHSWLQVARQAQKQGIACITELDDDFEYVHRENVAWRNVQPSLQPLSNYSWLHQTAAASDVVTVSTPALERWAPHGRSFVVRNYVTETQSPDRSSISDPRIGWSGATVTHPTDLQASRGGVARALRELDARFHILGDGAGVRDALSLPSQTKMTITPWVPTEVYLETLAESMEIGIVPLEQSNFNIAKSHLKGLEMAACGIPFVASDLPEYRRLNAYGLGELARSPGDWKRHLLRLVGRGRWITEGERQQQIVKDSFMISQHADEWAAAWLTAIEHRRSVDR